MHVCRYGVNPGSALAILGNSSVAGTAAVNTTISAACATFSALGLLMFLSYKETGHGVWDLIGAANGTLGGLVAITAGARTAPYSVLCDCTARLPHHFAAPLIHFRSKMPQKFAPQLQQYEAMRYPMSFSTTHVLRQLPLYSHEIFGYQCRVCCGDALVFDYHWCVCWSDLRCGCQVH